SFINILYLIKIRDAEQLTYDSRYDADSVISDSSDSSDSEECNYTIKLILQDNFYYATKDNLIKKSIYFERLFSPQYSKKPIKKHIINYDIDQWTFKNFIYWINEENREYSNRGIGNLLKPSMQRYLGKNVKDILHFLDVAALFMVDELIEDITDIIVLNWLNSKDIIDIWCFAKDLAIQPLTDICLSVCLDCFMDLPINDLIELPVNYIKELIQNNNIRSTQDHLNYVLQEWKSNNMDSMYNIEIDIAKTRKIEWTHYIIGIEEEISGRTKKYICRWKNDHFTRLGNLKRFKANEKDLEGYRIAGRGFSIYLGGGEFGIGSGQFNETIFRYCLIAKKWYYFSSILFPTRHMVFGFIDNTLIVAGGVSRHRIKIPKVQMLNIHTGQWRRSTNIPECFSTVPPHTFVNKKLFLLQTDLNIFDYKHETWKIISLNNITHPRPFCLEFGIIIFVIKNNETILHKIGNVQSTLCKRCIKLYKDHTVTVVRVMNHECLLEEKMIPDIGAISILCKVCKCRDPFFRGNKLAGLTLSPRDGIFCTINPSTLHCSIPT
ncbi:PREDICTED: uncharacterized protein LOC107070019, partial [Polistes dominula]|uniref:Uncharacterized protein LOC107070019 n=1 Tax=Polistes dominula TaxID=743375 RepID=A0ABM1ISW1_POLDO